MDELDQGDNRPDVEDEQSGTGLEPATSPEPDIESFEAEAEPEVQQSMTFDDIVAAAAADAAQAVPLGDDVEETAAAEEHVGIESPSAAADQSEDLDDMVAALRDGVAAKTATDHEAVQDAGTAAETVDDESVDEETLAEEEAYEEIEEEFAGTALARNRLGARLPAWVYAGIWVVFTGVMAYLLWPTATKSFIASQDYAYMVAGGLALTVAGPILALVTWLVTRMGTTASERIGLARAVWMRCMLATLFGVAVWWLALYALDLHRSGVIR